jgi:glycosyltransferase involved in cell wall biosynthesis
MGISSLIQAYGLAYSRNIAVSEFQRRYLEMEGIRVTSVINNPMSVVEPQVTAKTGDFVFLAGYSYFGKGFDVLEKLAETGWNIDCYTTGSKPGLLNYKAPVEHRHVLETIQRYRILLHPSRFESCGMTVLEAMSCGVPVLMAAVGVGASLRKEIPEFVVSGYDEEAVEEYRAKARIILADYQTFSRRAREYVERHHGLESFQQQWRRVLLG